MKYTLIQVVSLLILPFFASTQGNTCSSAIPITMDGVIRNYTTSSNIGGNVHCIASESSPVTYFSFTTNATADCPLISITAPGGACEIAMYTACNGGNTFQTTSSMCFYDGEGLWSPAHNYTLAANTTYYLRIKTTSAGNINIGAQPKKPTNDDCFGATPIGKVSITDNNACHRGGPGVLPEQLCAFTLENTAFYMFTIEETGTSTVYISNIACDNGPNDNSNGFQIGFFTGNCANLNYMTCSAGDGAAILASTYTLPAGTKVYVAIDGNSGSNCKYSISTTNATPMSVGIKDFSVWKGVNANVIRWTSIYEKEPLYFEIQRAEVGGTFSTIAKVNGKPSSNKVKTYSFEDRQPLISGSYRLKTIDEKGEVSYTTIITISREVQTSFSVQFNNPISDYLNLRITGNEAEKMELQIIDYYGQIHLKETFYLKKGLNPIRKDISRLNNGRYILRLVSNKEQYSKAIWKTSGERKPK